MSESTFAVPFACDPNRTTSSGFSWRRTASRRDSTRLASKSAVFADGGPRGEAMPVIVKRSAPLRSLFPWRSRVGAARYAALTV